MCRCYLPIFWCVPIGIIVCGCILCPGFVACHLGCMSVVGVGFVVGVGVSLGLWFRWCLVGVVVSGCLFLSFFLSLVMLVGLLIIMILRAWRVDFLFFIVPCLGLRDGGIVVRATFGGSLFGSVFCSWPCARFASGGWQSILWVCWRLRFGCVLVGV